MKEYLEKISENNTIIIVFANTDYQIVIENWIISIQQLKIKNFLVICLDKPLYLHLKTLGIPALLKPCSTNLNLLWIHRLEVIDEILQLNYNIVHSDADAIWIKNPLNKFIYNQPFDLIFSQGTIWPPDVHQVWEFVLCCVFFYVHSNPSTLALFKELIAQVRIEKDDQLSINRLLLKNIKEWNIIETYYLTYNNKKFKCSKNIMSAKFNNISIACLPHEKFQRIKEESGDIYVKHLISNKKAESIMTVLKENDCLYK